MKKIFTFLILFASFVANAQTWSDETAQIFYDKCAKCHHPGGAGATNYTNYAEVSGNITSILSHITDDKMPPWPPQDSYSNMAHKRSLTAIEKTTILNWIGIGSPEGNPANTPPPPVFNSEWKLGQGDLEVQIPTYASNATPTQDDYVCFTIPSGLTQGRTIKAVEVLPGNPEIVHHVLVFWANGGSTTTDTIGGNCASPAGGTLVYGWAPGSEPLVFPSGSALKLGHDIPANADIVLSMHYPGGSLDMLDSTKVRLHFYPLGETGIRQVQSDDLLALWTFTVPANQTTSLTSRFPNAGGIPSDASVLAVFPHMHQLGESMKVYGIKPTLDTVKLINIPKWDFDWQGFYVFKNLQKIPSGSYVKQECTMVNPTGSIVYPGLNTSDEMFLTYFMYLPYLPGDELHDIEALSVLATNDIAEKNVGDWKIAPNPFTDETAIHFSGLKTGDQLNLYVYDIQGNLVKKIISNQKAFENAISTSWDGTNDTGAKVNNGVYFVSLNVNGENFFARILKN